MAYALKLFEYMQYGLIVIMPDFGEWKKFNQEHNVGYCVDTTSAIPTALKLDSLLPIELSEIRKANKQAVIENFSWQSQELHLIRLYRGILNGTAA